MGSGGGGQSFPDDVISCKAGADIVRFVAAAASALGFVTKPAQVDSGCRRLGREWVGLAIMRSDSGASLAVGPATSQASRVGDGAGGHRGGSGGGHQWLLPHLMRRHRGGVDSTSRMGAPRF